MNLRILALLAFAVVLAIFDISVFCFCWNWALVPILLIPKLTFWQASVMFVIVGYIKYLLGLSKVATKVQEVKKEPEEAFAECLTDLKNDFISNLLVAIMVYGLSFLI